MAYENVGATVVAATAAGDLSTKQFYLVKQTATGVDLAGAGEPIIGVLQNKPEALGDAATVWGIGSVSKVVAGAAVSIGDPVAPDANGKAIGAVSTNFVAGFALEEATADGDIIAVFINQPGVAP